MSCARQMPALFEARAYASAMYAAAFSPWVTTRFTPTASISFIALPMIEFT